MLRDIEAKIEQSQRKREELVAARLGTSATSADIARQILGIPDHVNGETIVDLASGASPLTADLLQQANAYAFDILYRDPQRLTDAIEQHYKRVKRTILEVPKEYRQILELRMTNSIARFTRSFAARPERYNSGWLTELPFEDGFADRTVSLNGISELGSDPELLLAATKEAIRITKPGGSIVLAPFHTATGVNREFAKVHRGLFHRLQEERVSNIFHERYAVGDSQLDSRLRIIK